MKLRSCLLLCIAGALCLPAHADLYKTEEFTVFGDFLAMLESDWDGHDENGVPIEDRTRLRFMLRGGMLYTPTERWEFGLRLRTGNDDNQQTALITIRNFNGAPSGPEHVNLDRWYARADLGRGVWTWVGRNDLPFWRQDDLYWSNNVTPTGVAVGYERKNWNVHGGYYALPEGMHDYFGRMAAGQFVYERDGRVGYTVAGGVMYVDADSAESADVLLDGNDTRDYQMHIGSVQLRLRAGGRPLKLGADLLYNGADYGNEPDADQRHGWVALAEWGSTAQRGDWSVGWTFANIERFAANSTLAQNNWERWGTAIQTRNTDLRGHLLRGQYALNGRSKLIAELYMGESLTRLEDGNRARLDYYVRF